MPAQEASSGAGGTPAGIGEGAGSGGESYDKKHKKQKRHEEDKDRKKKKKEKKKKKQKHSPEHPGISSLSNPSNTNPSSMMPLLWDHSKKIFSVFFIRIFVWFAKSILFQYIQNTSRQCKVCNSGIFVLFGICVFCSTKIEISARLYSINPISIIFSWYAMECRK